MLERHDGFYGNNRLLPFERKAKEGTLLHPDYFTLIRVHLYLQFVKVSGNTGHHSHVCSLRLHEDDTVIGVSGESVLPPLKLIIEVIREDVTQKR